MKTLELICPIALTTIVLLMFLPGIGNAQTVDEAALIGTWEIQGTLMGDDGEGWLMPHKQAGADCESDHSVFAANHTAKEIRYSQSCEANEKTFNWRLAGDTLTLAKGERSVNWLIHSMVDNKMTVGVQAGPGSERRMYVVYQKRD